MCIVFATSLSNLYQSAYIITFAQRHSPLIWKVILFLYHSDLTLSSSKSTKAVAVYYKDSKGWNRNYYKYKRWKNKINLSYCRRSSFTGTSSFDSSNAHWPKYKTKSWNDFIPKTKTSLNKFNISIWPFKKCNTISITKCSALKDNKVLGEWYSVCLTIMRLSV